MLAQLGAGDAERASSKLTAARSRGLEDRTLTETQARIEAAMSQVDEMRATLTRLRGQSRGAATLIARSFLLEAQLEASLGNVDEALAAYAAADRADPTTPALQYAAAFALKSGRPSHARRLYRTLCIRDPDGRACTQEAQLAR
jgi:cytochrome c-type biogenesis protein CcmH/NrfG